MRYCSVADKPVSRVMNGCNKLTNTDTKTSIITGTIDEVVINEAIFFLSRPGYSTVYVSPIPRFINGAIKYTEFAKMVTNP